ncbi:MAG: hypothetical protein R6W91_02635 [Thermoplasmata archaeon]
MFINMFSGDEFLLAEGLTILLFFILTVIRVRLPEGSNWAIAVGLGRIYCIFSLFMGMASVSYELMNSDGDFVSLFMQMVLGIVLFTSFTILQRYPPTGHSLALKIGKIMFFIYICISTSFLAIMWVEEHYGMTLFPLAVLVFWIVVIMIWAKIVEMRGPPPDKSTLEQNAKASADAYWRMQDSRYQPPPPGSG